MTHPLRRMLGVLAGVIFLAGCAAPVAKLTSTASGKPEAVIAADPGQIKAAIIADLLNYGYQIEKDTPYMLEMTRPMKGSEDMAAAFIVGNAYTDNYRIATYTFVDVDGGVRVVASPSMRAHFPMGRVNNADLSDNENVYNTFQSQLTTLKTRLEDNSSAK